MKLLRAQSRQSNMDILLSWIFVVLFPAIILHMALDFFFEKRFEQSLTRIKPILQNELRVFMQDFDERIWLQRKMGKFDQESGYKLLNDAKVAPSGGAETIRRNLEKHLKFPVLAVFGHGVDSSSVSFDFNNNLKHDLPRPTVFFLRKLMNLLSEQHRFSLLFPESYAPVFSAQQLSEMVKTRHVYLQSFLRNFFSTILEVEVRPGEVVPSISSRCGDTGKVFFYYGVSRALHGNDQVNLAGYFAVVRAEDIPAKMLVAEVCSNPFNAEVRRSVKTVPGTLNLPDDFKNHDLSGFRIYDDRVALQSLIPEALILRLIQGGGIVPGGFEAFRKKIPLIEVSCSRTALEHPLQQHFPTVRFLIKILSLAGSLVFLRILIFGYEAATSIAIKIAAAVLFACLLPSVGLMLVAVAHDDYAQYSERNSEIQELKGRVAFCKNIVNSEMDLLAQQTLALGDELEKDPDRSAEKDEQILKHWADGMPIAGFLFRKFNSQTIEWWTKDYISQPGFHGERDSKWFLFHSCIEFLLNSHLITENLESLSTFITHGTNNYQTVGMIINSDGALLFQPRMATRTRLSIDVLSRKRGKIRIPMGLLMVDYRASKVANKILEGLQDKIIVSGTSGSGRFSLAVLKLSGKYHQFHEPLTAKDIDREFSERLIEHARSLKNELIYNYQKNGNDYSCIVELDEKLAMGFIAISQRPVRYGFSVQWLLPGFYVFLLMALSLVLSRQMFIKPLMTYIAGLKEIAAGNLQHKMVIETGDEFEMMAQECNQMTKELAEKAMLERYVSREILKEIQQTTESQLKPGGERVEAAIVFATLDLVSHEKKEAGSARMDYIGQFYEICNSICTSNGGMIDKVIGTALMMVFRADDSEKNHKNRACQAVFQIKNALQEIAQQRSLRFAAGINAGSVISGKIGSHTGKLDFTVIGDAVNLAARLKAHAAMFDEATIICSESVADLKSELFKIIPEAEIRVKGKAERIRIFRLTEI